MKKFHTCIREPETDRTPPSVLINAHVHPIKHHNTALAQKEDCMSENNALRSGASIEVRWERRGNDLIGQICHFPSGKAKRVYLDRNFSGPQPKHSQITKAFIVHNTHVEDSQRGVLFVRPVYPHATNALTREEASLKLAAIARHAMKRSPSFQSETVLKVDLPGWTGQLVGQFNRGRRPPPYNHLHCLTWSFIGNDGVQMRYIINPETQFCHFVITHGVTWDEQHVRWVISNWSQAIQDLGTPYSIERTDGTFAYKVSWRDHVGLFIRAYVREEEAAAFQDPPFPYDQVTPTTSP